MSYNAGTGKITDYKRNFFMKVSAQVPATIANLGCGFDCLGLALPIYNTVTIEETVLPGSGIEINILKSFCIYFLVYKMFKNYFF